MAELDNAKRTLNRATYCPIKPVEEGTPVTPGGFRVVDKWTATTGMNILPSEVGQLRQLLPGPDQRVIDIIERAFASDNKYAVAPKLEALPEFASVTPQDIVGVGTALIALRKKRHSALNEATTRIQSYLSTLPSTEIEETTEATLPKGFKKDEQFVSLTFPGATLYRFEETTPLSAPEGGPNAPSETHIPGSGTMSRQSFVLFLPRDREPKATAARVKPMPLTLSALANLSSLTAELQTAVTLLRETALTLIAGADPLGVELSDILTASGNSIQMATDALYGFSRRLEIEPVGYLHLERLGFTPAGIERGELVYSVPLSPAEEVNITHKEWSNTSEEFERIVTDFLEAYSEEGVTEKSELTQATTSQQQHSSGFNMSVTASGGFGPVTISASAGYNVADSASNSQQFARNPKQRAYPQGVGANQARTQDQLQGVIGFGYRGPGRAADQEPLY